MLKVLIVDAVPIFREFLKEKFHEERIEVFYSEEQRDSITKMVSILPDLVILNIKENFNQKELVDFLDKKKDDVNASRIPMIACGPSIDKTQKALLAQYQIIKYFEKPIKFDIFFEFIGKILKVSFTMDITPCVLDLHRNNDLIFIEVALGLNREKIALLKYRLTEMIDTIGIKEPKIIIMLTTLNLSFVDGLNIEFLLDNILSHPRISTKNVKILSFSKFVEQMIEGHPRYQGIEVTTKLPTVMNSLVENSQTASVYDLIQDKILTFNERLFETSADLRFHSDAAMAITPEESKNKVAIVDDDSVILRLLKGLLENEGIPCDTYTNGSEFLPKMNQINYKVVVLDIKMPGISGFDTLRRLKNLSSSPDVIIYSQVEKPLAIKALSLGAKYYIPKSQKPEVVIQKIKDFLAEND